MNSDERRSISSLVPDRVGGEARCQTGGNTNVSFVTAETTQRRWPELYLLQRSLTRGPPTQGPSNAHAP